MAKQPKTEDPRGKYYIEPKAGGGRVAMPEIAYEADTRATVVSATEAARRFSDLINRASYQGETFVIERGGKPLCQLGPIAEQRCTGADLLDLFARLPKPPDEFLDAVEEIIRNQEPVGPSPWEK
jgi:antitoxin (DNA-binding transcriptional repressor) of toxin-antitoxin stability system